MNREQNQREMIVRLFQISNLLQTYMDQILKPNNLTIKQFFMMIIIGSFGYNPRIGEVSERFATSRQNVKQVLLKLQKSGYLELYKDETDSRITRVRLTKYAQEFWMNRENEDNIIMNSIFNVLDDEELNVSNNSLVKLVTQITMLKGEL